MIKEFELIEWIRQQIPAVDHLRIAIGDDCAVQKPLSGQDLLTTSDLLIEGVHFLRHWTSLYDLGRKAVAVNISDIAAMGGKPLSLFLSLGRPIELGDSDLKELISGILFEIRRHGAVLAGGDMSRSPAGLILSVTVQGCISAGQAICRRGAAAGDSLYVSGSLGDSALALSLLKAGRQPEPFLAQRFHLPTPRVGLGQLLVENRLATAMLDVSDGLLGDLAHILDASEVGAELELADIPLSPAFRQELEQDTTLIELALAGGEDYELLFTSPRGDLMDQLPSEPRVTLIGQIITEPGVRIRQADGALFHCRRKGFDHFV